VGAPRHRQACYVLASDRWDDYGAMGCISAATLRRVHPDVDITFVVDGDTAAALGPRKKTIERFANRILEITDIHGTARERSRVLKTTMRRHLEGPFVFFDLDTLIVRPVDRLFDSGKPFEIALDYETGAVNERDRPVYEGIDRAHYPNRAFNSGVMVIDDTVPVRAMFDEWHRRWRLSRELGKLDDQQSLNSTIAATSFPVSVLASSYNSMILYFPQRFRTCHVAHFLASTKMSRTLMTDLLEAFHNSDDIDWTTLDRCVREGHPWGRTPEPWQLMRSRNYVRAAWARVRRNFSHDVAAGA
jgi:hypothetical protein